MDDRDDYRRDKDEDGKKKAPPVPVFKCGICGFSSKYKKHYVDARRQIHNDSIAIKMCKSKFCEANLDNDEVKTKK